MKATYYSNCTHRKPKMENGLEFAYICNESYDAYMCTCMHHTLLRYHKPSTCRNWFHSHLKQVAGLQLTVHIIRILSEFMPEGYFLICWRS